MNGPDNDPAPHAYHLPCGQRWFRMISLYLLGGCMIAIGGSMWAAVGLTWWTGALTGVGGLLVVYAGIHTVRGPVTLVLYVEEKQTLFATLKRSSSLGSAAELDHTSIGYSVSVPLAALTHLWQDTSTLNLIPTSDTLKIAVEGKHRVLADLLLNMAHVKKRDVELMATFLLQYQPHLTLSYPWPER